MPAISLKLPAPVAVGSVAIQQLSKVEAKGS